MNHPLQPSKLSLSINPHLDNLLDTWILRQIQFVFIRNTLRQEPSTQEMPSLVILHARLRRSQTNERLRHELRSRAFLGWPALNVPGTGRINAQNGDTGCFDLGDDGWEGFAEGSAE